MKVLEAVMLMYMPFESALVLIGTPMSTRAGCLSQKIYLCGGVMYFPAGLVQYVFQPLALSYLARAGF